jgi:arylsulfatase A-like enzyme
MHTLRRALGALCITLLSACAGPQSAAEGGAATPAPTRPNIVLIIADDLGYGDISLNGSSVIRTPNIDAIAAQGINFTNGHVAAAVCAPSRAAIFSGRHPQRFGYEFNPRGRDREGVGLPLTERALPEYLHDVGYRTALIGKWHLGRSHDLHPASRFDEFFGFAGGGTGYLVQPGPGDEWLANPVEGSRAGFQPMELERGYEPLHLEGGYMTDLLTDEAVAFIDRNQDRPFFLTVSYHAPHTPLQATARYLQRYANIEDQGTRIYAAMVSAMDDGVGRIMETLRQRGLAENTIVVFMSDNGCAAYIGIGRCSNQPFAGYKGTYFEGGTRVPMIASWPGHLPRGVVYDQSVMSLDWTATLLALGGVDTSGRNLDGVDLMPFLTSDTTREAPRHRVFWRTLPNYAMIDDDWKLLVMERADGQGMVTLLFNLAEDPGETHNLASQHPEIVARLNAEFQEWSSNVPAPAFESQREASFPLPGDGTVVNVYN